MIDYNDRAIKAVHNGQYCDTCKHLVKIDGKKYCESWNCEFEPDMRKQDEG